MKYITRPPALFIAIIFSTTIAAATASTTAVAADPPPPPCPPQSASLPDPASTAAAINAATQALQATNITSQLAITSSKEVMEKNKTYYEGLAATNKSYYEDMTTKLLWAAAAFAFLVSAGGFGAIEIANRRRINKLARKAVANFAQMYNEHMAESKQFHTDIQSFVNDTTSNLKGFTLLTPTFSQITDYCSDFGHLEASSRPNADRLIAKTVKTCDEVLGLKPTNQYLLGLTYSVKGVALSLDNKIQAAYEACKASLDHHPDQPGPLYNLACNASRLTKYDEAKRCLQTAIALDITRAAQAAKDGDFIALLNDHEFRRITGLPPNPETPQTVTASQSPSDGQ